MIAVVLVGLSLCGCATGSRKSALTVQIGPPVHYRSANGVAFVARYGSLSDGSLWFVMVTMPDGREHTLPRVVSASGARYTDEREIVWWTHQGKVRVETRDAQGNWGTTHPELHEIPVRD